VLTPTGVIDDVRVFDGAVAVDRIRDICQGAA